LKLELGAEDAKLKLASVAVVVAAGLAVIVVSGGVGAPTVHMKEAAVGSRWPSLLSAATSKVWEPGGRLEYAIGELQTLGAALSSEHWKRAFASEDVKEKLASLELVEAGGAAVIVVSGGGESGPQWSANEPWAGPLFPALKPSTTIVYVVPAVAWKPARLLVVAADASSLSATRVRLPALVPV
jgi:hypothetical protein